MPITTLPIFVLSFLGLTLFSYLCTEGYRRYAIHQGVLDTPTARSSHDIPTPRGGGISIIIGFLVVIGALSSLGLLKHQVVAALLIATLPVALVGLIDDHAPLSSKLRFTIHLICAGSGAAMLPNQPQLLLGTLSLSLDGFWLIPTAIALTWLTNLYNFMDGIDGIAASEALSVLAGVSVITWLSGGNPLPPIILCAPILGFLLLNWAPAKIFMGDAGSGFLGAFLGILALATSETINLWCWVILLSAFITDATWTLLTRIFTGQKWHSPHRSHAYQILNRKLKSAPRVNWLLFTLNFIWLTPLAYLAQRHPHEGALLSMIAILPTLYTCYHLRAGKLESNH